MDGSTFRGRSIKFLGLSVVAAIIATAGFALGSRPESAVSEGKFHQIVMPAFNASASTGCVAEATTYAAAVLNLQRAQQLADQAYEDWFKCENGGPPPSPDPNPIPKLDLTFSILEQTSLAADSE